LLKGLHGAREALETKPFLRDEPGLLVLIEANGEKKIWRARIFVDTEP
jgi:hypothetical protein